jgi:hypothetical protein
MFYRRQRWLKTLFGENDQSQQFARKKEFAAGEIFF